MLGSAKLPVVAAILVFVIVYLITLFVFNTDSVIVALLGAIIVFLLALKKSVLGGE